MIKSKSKVLALLGRPECGVQLAWGFPPRSKWTYGEVFHPAVVPQPPFTQLFLRHKNRTSHKIHNNHLIPSCCMTERTSL